MTINIGRFNVTLKSSLPQVARGVIQLYADFPLASNAEFTDFRVELGGPTWLRRVFRPQVNFAFDGRFPFKPLPVQQAFAMFEWGLNWVISNHAHQFAIVHAAALEKDGRGIIFPGSPGSGKSTLCAALTCRGWRLLSDEMALISLQDGSLWPIPRPISLKNASIELIRNFREGVIFGDVVADTLKGNVAHMRPPLASVQAFDVPATPYAIVFPTYRPESITDFAPLSKGMTLMRLADNCFNYSVLGGAGFNCLADAVERSRCHTLVYSDLDDAIRAIEG